MRTAGHICSLLTASILGCLFMLVCGCLSALAQEPSPAVLIIDSSGSMSAKLQDGRTRLDAARQVIASTLLSWPEGGNVAVMAYGHRRKSDCADIETIVPLGPLSSEAVNRALQRLSARGKTPLSQSLEKAAALLPEGGTIVLVSDGIENCASNPCEVAAALKAAHGDIIIHVIGFGLQDKEIAHLNCIAGNAGGEFFEAQNADGLLAALKTVSVAVAEPEPPPELQKSAPVPPPLIGSPPKIVRTELIAVAGALGEIINTPVQWSVTNASGTAVYDGEGRAIGIDLLPGSYSVTAATSNARFATQITVAAKQGQSFKINVNAGRLDLSLKPYKGAPPYTDQEVKEVSWSLQPLGKQAAALVPAFARPSLLLAPGPYRVRAQLKKLTAEADVDIVAGAVSNAELEFRLGTLILEAMLEGDDQPLSDAELIHWRVGTGATAESIEGQARPQLVLREGSYSIDLSVAGFEVTANANVRAGEESLVRLVIRGGTLLLSAKLGPESPVLEDWRDALWTITPVETLAGAAPDDIQQASPSVPLAAGRWRIGLKSGVATVEQIVTVGPDSNTALAVSLEAGRLTIRGRPDAGTLPSNIVFAVTAFDRNGNLAAEPSFVAGSNEEISTILPKGRWRVTADDSNGRHGELLVDLAIGEEKALEIVLE